MDDGADVFSFSDKEQHFHKHSSEPSSSFRTSLGTSIEKAFSVASSIPDSSFRRKRNVGKRQLSVPFDELMASAEKVGEKPHRKPKFNLPKMSSASSVQASWKKNTTVTGKQNEVKISTVFRNSSLKKTKLPNPDTLVQYQEMQDIMKKNVSNFVQTVPQLYDKSLVAYQPRNSAPLDADRDIYLASTTSNTHQGRRRSRAGSGRYSVSTIGWDVALTPMHGLASKSQSTFPSLLRSGSKENIKLSRSKEKIKRLNLAAKRSSEITRIISERSELGDIEDEQSRVRVKIFQSGSRINNERTFDNFTADIHPLSAICKEGEDICEEQKRMKEQVALSKTTDTSHIEGPGSTVDMFSKEDCESAFNNQRIPTLRKNPAHIKWPTIEHPPEVSPFPSVTTIDSDNGRRKSYAFEASSYLSLEQYLNKKGYKSEKERHSPELPQLPQWVTDFQRYGSVRVDQHFQGHPRFYPWAPFNPEGVNITRCEVMHRQTPPHLTKTPLGPLIADLSPTNQFIGRSISNLHATRLRNKSVIKKLRKKKRTDIV